MSSGGSGRLSRAQKGKAVARATESSPARVVESNSPSDFETIHREAMMDTENMDTPQRVLVAESARQLREEREAASLIARDGQGGASEGEASLPDFVPCCYHPEGIFEDLPALAPGQMRSPVVEGQTWENVEETRSTPSSVKALLRECGGVGVTFLIPTRSQRLRGRGPLCWGFSVSTSHTFRARPSSGFRFLDSSHLMRDVVTQR